MTTQWNYDELDGDSAPKSKGSVSWSIVEDSDNYVN